MRDSNDAKAREIARQVGLGTFWAKSVVADEEKVMFEEILIESAGRDRRKGSWIPALLSSISHVALIGAVMMAGYYVKENPEVIERPMAAFIVSAPPPPPPPPPGPSSSAATTPRVEMQREPSRPAFEQPREMPRELHEVAENASPRENASGEDDGGMPGGVAGGKPGGTVGGEIGGELGGAIGGQLGGKVGGQIGGGGEALPVRVGGNVLPPKIVSRVDPQYTEAARRAKIEGIVIIEAVIDQHGDVTEARILKSLAFGLDQQALNAIRAWKFKPGTLNGQAVRVYYNLTVNFQIE